MSRDLFFFLHLIVKNKIKHLFGKRDPMCLCHYTFCFMMSPRVRLHLHIPPDEASTPRKASFLPPPLYQQCQRPRNFPNRSERFTSLISCHRVPERRQALSSHQDQSEIKAIIRDNHIKRPDEARFIVWGDAGGTADEHMQQNRNASMTSSNSL